MPVVLHGWEASVIEPGRTIERHHHLRGYAAVLVKGAYEEAGDSGRHLASPGDVIVHRPLEAHRDRIGATGALLINLTLGTPRKHGFGFVSDLDVVVRAYERDPVEAAAALHAQFRPHANRDGDWPDLLAESLSHPGTRLENWADRHGLNPSSLSRGFRLAYGVTPKRFRYELMASAAARSIHSSSEALSKIATATGFADQAHMTRALVGLFGFTPTQLRRLG
jgi:AraC-like DNA-binding protein